MEGIKIACGQITWGRDYPREKVLAEIAEAGYEGAPVGRPDGSTAKQAREEFEKYGLKPAPGFIALGWGDPAPIGEVKEIAARQAAFSRELGLTELYISANFPKDRIELAGQINPQNASTDEQLAEIADKLNQVGEVTLKEGVRICFHNHVGTPVETRDEIDRLFAKVDPRLVYQGPDIGHLVWAGDEVTPFIEKYGPTIKTLHVKDIDRKIRDQGVAEKWDYQKFNFGGVFAELGEGMIDFPSMFAALKKEGFTGWLVVETDVTTKSNALESAKISRAYLKSIGV